MKKMIFILVVMFLSCTKEGINIQNQYYSYRYPLWSILSLNGYDVSYTGTQIDNRQYRYVSGRKFSVFHEGIPEATTGFFNSRVNEIIGSVQKPDVILIGLGICDIMGNGKDYHEPLTNIICFAKMLTFVYPDVLIFIEQIAPGKKEAMTHNSENSIVMFNEGIESFALSEANIFSVDMYSGFKRDYYADIVHYNRHGAYYVARQYYDAITSQIGSANPIIILPIGDSRVAGTTNL